MAATSQYSSFKERENLCSDLNWEELYRILPPYVLSCIRCTHVPAWRCQEYDLVDDIVQETVVRIFLYVQKSQRGEASFINSVRHFSKSVAHNHCQDLFRRESRFAFSSYDDTLADTEGLCDIRVDPIEQILEDMMLAQLFPEVARRIAAFPAKQREALLIDLANRSIFDESGDSSFTPLEQAFLAVGIHLMEYQRPLPDDAVARSRHTACLSVAYRRLREKTSVQLRDLVA